MPDLTWTSETNWQNAQDSDGIELDGGSFGLASAIPDSGILRYNYEDDANTTTIVDSWVDNTHTAYDATNNGGAYTTTAKYGSFGLELQSSDDISYPFDSSMLNFPVSFGTWIYPLETPPWSTDGTILGSGWVIGFRLPNGRSDLELRTFASEGGSANSVYSNTELTGNAWNFIGFSLSGSTATVVQAGIEENSGTGYDSSEDNRSVATGGGVSFVLDQTDLYDKALTATEWSNLYSTGSING